MATLRWLALTGLGGLGVGYGLGRALYDFSRPSDGEPIDSAATGTALLVLDAQDTFTKEVMTEALGAPAVSAAITRINALALVARRRGWPIVQVRTCVQSPRQRLALGMIGARIPTAEQAGARFDARLELSGAQAFDKDRGDALSNPALDAYLRDRAIRRLLVTGLDGITSVQRTARGALQRHYDVVLVDDAILSAHPEDWAAWQDRLRILGVTRTSVTEHER